MRACIASEIMILVIIFLIKKLLTMAYCITFGENGQPIGDNLMQLSSKIGEVVRTYVSPIYLRWTKVPKELKEQVSEIVSVSACSFTSFNFA